MKYLIKLSVPFFFLLHSFIANSQLLGSDEIIARSFEYENFKNLIIEDFDGKIEIEIGKPYSIEVSLNENLESRLRVEEDPKAEKLKIYLKGNDFGKLYLEKTNITIKVSLPECANISHRGNTFVKVTGINGHHFKLNQYGNGSVNLFGEVDQLVIDKKGNGSIYSKRLLSKTAKVKSEGNGDVYVNSQISLNALGSGNGDIVQVGPGKIETLSGVVGNGKVIKRPLK